MPFSAKNPARSAAPPLPPGAVSTIAVMIAAAFVVILNETILNVALPALMADLHVTAATVQWVATGFMLTMAVVIPTTGFILQRLTARSVYALAMGLFTIGTLISALAPGFAILLLGRVIQGAGSAVMIPLLMTTILRIVPLERRGAVMGNITLVIAVAPALGPTVSGVILSVLPWRFLFWFILPIAIAALVVGLMRLPADSEPGDERLDVLSVLLSIPGFGGLVYGLSELGKTDADRSLALAVLGAGVVLVAAFVLRQIALQRRSSPLLDMRIFGYRVFSVATGMMAVMMSVLFGTVILLPIFMLSVRGLDSITTGLVLLPGGLMMGLLGPAIGRLFDSIGARPLTVAGTMLVSAVLAGLSFVPAAAPVWLLIAAHIVFSLGLALIFTPVFTAGLNPLPEHLYSHGSATLSTLQQVASAAGTALLVAIMQATAGPAAAGGAGAGAEAGAGTDAGAGAGAAGPDAVLASQLLDGLHAAFQVAFLLSLIAVVLAFFMPGRVKPVRGVIDAGPVESDGQPEPAGA